MANIKYFCDLGDQAVEVQGIYSMPNVELNNRFPGVKAQRWAGKSKSCACRKRPGAAPGTPR